MNKQTMTKGLFALIAIALVASFAGTAKSNAVPNTPDVNAVPPVGITEAQDIPFNDQAHIFYFRHQTWLVKHKKEGKTPEIWAKLSPAEHVAAVKEGEAFLKKLKAELSAKPVLTPEETDLFQAVWGDNGGNDEKTAEILAAQKNPAPKENKTLEAISNNLESVKHDDDWSRMFDGGRSRGGAAPGVVVAGQANISGNAAGGSQFNFPAASKPVPVNDPVVVTPLSRPMRGTEPEVPANMPLAVGGGLMAASLGFLALYKGLAGKSAATTLHADIMKELDARSATNLYHDLANGTPESSGTSLTKACKTCSGGCRGKCGVNCTAKCGLGCTGTCFGTCEGGCKVKTGPLSKDAMSEALAEVSQPLKENNYPR